MHRVTHQSETAAGRASPLRRTRRCVNAAAEAFSENRGPNPRGRPRSPRAPEPPRPTRESHQVRGDARARPAFEHTVPAGEIPAAKPARARTIATRPATSGAGRRHRPRLSTTCPAGAQDEQPSPAQSSPLMGQPNPHRLCGCQRHCAPPSRRARQPGFNLKAYRQANAARTRMPSRNSIAPHTS